MSASDHTEETPKLLSDIDRFYSNSQICLSLYQLLWTLHLEISFCSDLCHILDI